MNVNHPGKGSLNESDFMLDAEETASFLRELDYETEGDDGSCVAVRLFKPDGSWEDVVRGGTPEEQEEALEALKRMYGNTAAASNANSPQPFIR